MRFDDCAIRPSRAVRSMCVDFYLKTNRRPIIIVGRLLVFFFFYERNERSKRGFATRKNVFTRFVRLNRNELFTIISQAFARSWDRSSCWRCEFVSFNSKRFLLIICFFFLSKFDMDQGFCDKSLIDMMVKIVRW